MSQCSHHAIEIKNDIDAYNAMIQEEKCKRCNLCFDICPVNHPVQNNAPLKWYQGWANEESIRANASSGGVATSIADYVINKGGIVFSCVFHKGKFIFKMASTREELKQFQGSKYVKSNPMDIYRDIQHWVRLAENIPVLMIGLPCQIAGVKRAIPKKYSERLLTVDLICHGTPAPQILERFMAQYGLNLSEIKKISFRSKSHFQVDPLGSEKVISIPGVADCYMRAFLEGIVYTENCYQCPYARKERISDVTVGDSWGTELRQEMVSGVSLILCNTERGVELVENADLTLHEVNIQNAIANNQQLNQPISCPTKRRQFMRAIRKGMPFNRALARYFPLIYLRYVLKRIYIMLPVDPLKKHSGGYKDNLWH